MQSAKINKPYEATLKVGKNVIKVVIGKYAEQTAAEVMASCGETMVHTVVALGGKSNLGYFPLQVEYREKLYAGGIIKGSRWVKREGRPTDDAILTARVIDRSIRPLFPDNIKNDIQVINTVYSYDGINDPDMLALLSTTLALNISAIPFLGPVAGLRVCYNKQNKEYVFNPNIETKETSDLDMILSGNDKSIVMVEAGANEVSEEVVLEAMQKSQQVMGEICKQITKITQDVGQEKIDLAEKIEPKILEAKQELVQKIEKKYSADILAMVKKKARLQDIGMEDFVKQLEKEFVNQEEPLFTDKDLIDIVYDLMKKQARDLVLNKGERPDGRKTDEIREISCEVDVFPRTHGSAMFKRGATQACTIATLGSPSLGQYVEDIEGENVRHYIHHYNMPPFASGETGRYGYPKRREIGHGALAERALLPMIPSQEEFSYTIRVVSEIMSSNGSTSQASVCGSTLSLMAAGVPIKKPVSGIAMGLMTDEKNSVILSDIQGLEDHIGDMDFKVAGTKDGITALQMDIKLTGIKFDILQKALKQAKEGRIFILNKMLECISEPRKSLSNYAPKIQQITISADRIGELIGPGGKIIKSIIEESGAEIDVSEGEDEDGEKIGVVNISSPERAAISKAAQLVDEIMRVIEVGEEFDAPITRIEKYGVFVDLKGGKEGLVHVSQMSTGYIKDVSDKYNIGDIVHVRVSGIKDDGKIELSMLTKEEAQEQASQRKSRSSRSKKRNYKDRRNNNNNHRNHRSGKKQFRSSLMKKK